jgi:hypothetical protein
MLISRCPNVRLLTFYEAIMFGRRRIDDAVGLQFLENSWHGKTSRRSKQDVAC